MILWVRSVSPMDFSPLHHAAPALRDAGPGLHVRRFQRHADVVRLRQEHRHLGQRQPDASRFDISPDWRLRAIRHHGQATVGGQVKRRLAQFFPHQPMDSLRIVPSRRKRIDHHNTWMPWRNAARTLSTNDSISSRLCLFEGETISTSATMRSPVACRITSVRRFAK